MSAEQQSIDFIPDHAFATDPESQIRYDHEDTRHFSGAPKTAVLRKKPPTASLPLLIDNPINQIFLKAVGEAI